MVIKYNNAWWCKIKIWTSIGGADSNIGGAPQKGLMRLNFLNGTLFPQDQTITFNCLPFHHFVRKLMEVGIQEELLLAP